MRRAFASSLQGNAHCSRRSSFETARSTTTPCRASPARPTSSCVPSTCTARMASVISASKRLPFTATASRSSELEGCAQADLRTLAQPSVSVPSVLQHGPHPPIPRASAHTPVILPPPQCKVSDEGMGKVAKFCPKLSLVEISHSCSITEASLSLLSEVCKVERCEVEERTELAAELAAVSPEVVELPTAPAVAGDGRGKRRMRWSNVTFAKATNAPFIKARNVKSLDLSSAFRRGSLSAGRRPSEHALRRGSVSAALGSLFAGWRISDERHKKNEHHSSTDIQAGSPGRPMAAQDQLGVSQLPAATPLPPVKSGCG